MSEVLPSLKSPNLAGCADGPVDADAGRPLSEFASDTYSQFGEDGILAVLLERIEPLVERPDGRRWVIEFGAWDGVQYSNTRRLIEEGDTSAVLIEADARRHLALVENNLAFDDVHSIHATVGWGPDDGLDAILDRTPCPAEPDLLSIDIDGNDYHVWSALERYRPRVVVVEFNPTIPTHENYVQPADPEVRTGSSVRGLEALAHRKGYCLVAVTAANAIFVERRLYPAVGLADNRLMTLRRDNTAPLTWLCHGFDGTCFLVGSKHMIWHDVPMTDARAQQLPRSLRRHTESLGVAEHELREALGRRRREHSAARANGDAR